MAMTSPDVIPLNDLARATAESRNEVVEAVTRVVDSGWYLDGGEVRAFEDAFASYVGVSTCIGVANGTDALELALRGVGCSSGDEVLTAANAGMYTTIAASRAGMTVRYADVDPSTLCLSRATVEAALTPQTRAVVVTHLYGLLADVDDLAELCADAGVALVEDCAQAVGAERRGRRAGSFGDAAAFSFYPTKNLGALGDAGAVLTTDADGALLVRSLAQYGWTEKYRVVHRGGRNSRLDELQAAVLRARLSRLDESNERRRELVLRYADALPAHAGRFIASADASFVAHLAVFLAADRNAARAALDRAGIMSGVHYPIPDHRQPVWGDRFAGLDLPVTEDAARRVVSIPCFPELTEHEVDRICEALRAL
jgi:dTDP-4-amino-4,6-dideoxygalactose transaminase